MRFCPESAESAIRPEKRGAAEELDPVDQYQLGAHSLEYRSHAERVRADVAARPDIRLRYHLVYKVFPQAGSLVRIETMCDLCKKVLLFHP